MVRLFIKEATTYYKCSYRNVCKSNFMCSKRTMHHLSKLDICTVSYVDLNIHSLDHPRVVQISGDTYVFNFLCFQKNFYIYI